MASGHLLDRDTIAGELRELASRPGLATRQGELQELGSALSGRGDVDAWAELDLTHVFVRPESVRAAVVPRSEHRVWSLIEIALGTLVFLPLLVTWSGLMQATSAYQALIGSDATQAGRPFLQLWQSGFEGRLAAWATFGHVALYATLFIAVLLALSVVHGSRKAGADRREAAAAQEAESLLAELVPLLTRAQLVLHERRRAAPQRFAAELTGAAQTLERLGSQAVDTQRDLGEAARLVEQSLVAAKDRLADVGASVDPLQQAVRRVEKALRDGVGQLSDTVRDSAGQLSVTVRDGAAATDSLVHRSGQRSTDAAELVKQATDRVGAELARAGDRVEDAVRDLAVAQRGFTTGAETVADVTGQVLERLVDTVRQVAELAGQVATASDATLAAADRVDRTAARLAADVLDAVAARQQPAPVPLAGEGRPVVLAKEDHGVDLPGPARPRPGQFSDEPARRSTLELDELPVRQAGR
ncbi:methyl-accepting chemotaxis protein [Kitasatospora sp. NBC_00240]|uniref:methyl-accepting chemotaxis protein n=1 Tax=Kitasatospora sp. NBC_00240 TaxID=2903567 RepID=UPI002259AEE0|nr:methyl-accepting chemotaxis protein [Kitasatospora sp. NBC_00240]MCX5212347.1 methyl-accepting chemotaxis protein [Kitasatospora sp. NBC_00240]